SRRDRKTGEVLQDLMVLPHPSQRGTVLMPLSADARTLCVVSLRSLGPSGNGIFLYDLKTGKERFRVTPGNGFSIPGAAPRLSADGKLVATTDTTPTLSTIRLWNTTTGKLVKAIDVTGALTGAIEFSRGGRELIACYGHGEGRGFLGVWDVATGKQ